MALVLGDCCAKTVVVVPGGGGGSGDRAPFEYQMPVAQTTAQFTHDLGYDPVSFQVIGPNGQMYDEFDVAFPVADSQVRVSFDIPIRALIRVK